MTTTRRSLFTRLASLFAGAAVAKVVPVSRPVHCTLCDNVALVDDDWCATCRAGVLAAHERHGWGAWVDTRLPRTVTMRLAPGERVEKGDALYVRADGCVTRDPDGRTFVGSSEEPSAGPMLAVDVRGMPFPYLGEA